VALGETHAVRIAAPIVVQGAILVALNVAVQVAAPHGVPLLAFHCVALRAASCDHDHPVDPHLDDVHAEPEFPAARPPQLAKPVLPDLKYRPTFWFLTTPMAVAVLVREILATA
jgi:hypothetical protein